MENGPDLAGSSQGWSPRREQVLSHESGSSEPGIAGVVESRKEASKAGLVKKGKPNRMESIGTARCGVGGGDGCRPDKKASGQPFEP